MAKPTSEVQRATAIRIRMQRRSVTLEEAQRVRNSPREEGKSPEKARVVRFSTDQDLSDPA
jgi:endonuclease V-like protein UPF0215 family